MISQYFCKLYVAMYLTVLSLIFSTAFLTQSNTANASPVCADGIKMGKRFNNKTLSKYITGTWNMVAPGQGFTTGVNRSSFKISYNKSSRRFILSGDGAPPVKLAPIFSAPTTSPLWRVDWTKLRVGQKKGNKWVQSMTVDDMVLVTDCNLDNVPRYWWKYNRGNNVSWGMYIFIRPDYAVGYIYNNKHGARTVYLVR